MKYLKLSFTLLISAFVLSTLTGCVTTLNHHNSSVVTYLYPNQTEPIETSHIPVLSLPLKVGIAFVPEFDMNRNLTERDKLDLMNEVSKHFKQYAFVKSIAIIPSAYLRPQGSFSNLNQIRTMFGIDVIALISYDQSQFTDQGVASISYWTLLGAYVVSGERNDTHTMVDAAVYHIKSRKMLFRAPGISHIKGKATPVNLSEQLRVDTMKGFQEASLNLVTNLDEQLELFKEKTKESPEDFQVVHKPGYTGGGYADEYFALIGIILGVFYIWQVARRKI